MLNMASLSSAPCGQWHLSLTECLMKANCFGWLGFIQSRELFCEQVWYFYTGVMPLKQRSSSVLKRIHWVVALGEPVIASRDVLGSYLKQNVYFAISYKENVFICFRGFRRPNHFLGRKTGEFACVVVYLAQWLVKGLLLIFLELS